MAAAAQRWQHGGGGQLGSLATALQQRGGSAVTLAVALRWEVQEAQRWQRGQCIGGGGQCVDSAMEASIAAAAAATAVLPPLEVKITIVIATNKQ